ncbi:MAG: SAM-dependent methyltransferase [Firmicutes bacterium]|nr:SAM-dependent methyltransferase [Bacillota bacterium]
MIKLSDRLMLIASQIDNSETMADVGTDHGFLPMYLADEGICPRVILADVSKGSLEKGRQNVSRMIKDRYERGRFFEEGTFDYRLGDGIRVLKHGEVDAVVIAGMGGILIADIITDDMEKAVSLKKYVLQPRNNQGKLRYSLMQKGFEIKKNLLVREGKFICDVIVVSAPERPDLNIELPYSEGDIRYEVPDNLLENGELATEYIERRLRKEKEILESLGKSGVITDEIRRKKLYFRERITYLSDLLGGKA